MYTATVMKGIGENCKYTTVQCTRDRRSQPTHPSHYSATPDQRMRPLKMKKNMGLFEKYEFVTKPIFMTKGITNIGIHNMLD